MPSVCVSSNIDHGQQPMKMHTEVTLTNRTLHTCLCDVIEIRMTSFQPEKMPFDAIFPGEMTLFVFLSQHRDTKAMFYLFYKITSALPQKKTHNFIQLICHLCLHTLIQNEHDVKHFPVL